MSEELTGLFGSDDTNNNEKDENDWVPDGWKNLGTVESNYEDNNKLDPGIRVNKFFPNFHEDEELDNGLGRDKLAEYVWNQLEDDFESGKITDLQVYLLDELDREGSLIGKEVFHYVEEFVDSNGSPNYLENFSYQGV